MTALTAAAPTFYTVLNLRWCHLFFNSRDVVMTNKTLINFFLRAFLQLQCNSIRLLFNALFLSLFHICVDGFTSFVWLDLRFKLQSIVFSFFFIIWLSIEHFTLHFTHSIGSQTQCINIIHQSTPCLWNG